MFFDKQFVLFLHLVILSSLSIQLIVLLTIEQNNIKAELENIEILTLHENIGITGMNFYGDMPDSYNFVVNENSGLISKILRDIKEKTASSLTPVLTEIRELEDNISNLRNQKDSDGKIKPEAESTIKECEARLSEKQTARDAAYSSFAAESDEMKQLVDLSLLSVGLLKGSALDNFISRSMKML